VWYSFVDLKRKTTGIVFFTNICLSIVDKAPEGFIFAVINAGQPFSLIQYHLMPGNQDHSVI